MYARERTGMLETGLLVHCSAAQEVHGSVKRDYAEIVFNDGPRAAQRRRPFEGE